ncbi:hypothetical protein GCM10009682_11430 [Luedemannella flava]|uniref:Uncharacterized protein n=1 Tax=Luedemannella flava TaxID=349316 RepID=A0ABN2LKE0_9ACTN
MWSLRAADSRFGGGFLYASVTSYMSKALAPRILDPTGPAGDAELRGRTWLSSWLPANGLQPRDEKAP